MAVDQNYVWLGTNGDGVFKWNKSTNKYEQYTSVQGLTNNKITAITIDSGNNLWIGTNGGGLNKFDGKNWTNYTVTQGLASDTVFSIVFDNQKNMWVGTKAGASKFNGQNWTTFTTKNSGIPANSIRVLGSDQQNNVWFGTASTLCRFDGKDWVRFTVVGEPFTMACDRNGTLWFGSTYGYYYNFDGKTMTGFSTIRTIFYYPNRITSMATDKEGMVWMGTDGGGLAQFDGYSWERHVPSSRSLGDGNILALTVDTDSTLWIATDGAGLYRKEKYRWTPYPTDDLFVNPVIKDIAIESTGIKWFATYGGVARFDGNNWKVYTEGNTDKRIQWRYINTVAIDHRGKKWIGGDWGLCSYNDTTWDLLLTGKNINVIEAAHKREVWVGMDSGVYKFDTSGSTLFTMKDGLTGNNVTAIAFDKKSNIWFGTNYRYNEGIRGITKFDGHNWKTYGFLDGLPSSEVNSIVVDHENNKWFGTAEGGFMFDEVVWTMPQDLYNGSVIYTLSFDRSGNLWFGTKQGLVIYDGNTVKRITTNEGLTDNSVFSIEFDSLGNAWIGTYNGINVLENQIQTAISGVGNQSSKPIVLRNYPNPFNPVTTIEIQVTKREFAKLTIYNILGQEIKVLFQQIVAPGVYKVVWDGTNAIGLKVPSGLYFYNLRTRSFIKTNKMVLLR